MNLATLKACQAAPCGGCPWRRTSDSVGVEEATRLFRAAHAEEEAHCSNDPEKPCTGMLIYQANVFHNPGITYVDPDEETVFDYPAQFLEHHAGIL